MTSASLTGNEAMSYKLERLQDLPVLLLEFEGDAAFEELPLENALNEVFAALEAEQSPIYHIVDMRHLKMTFNDILNSIQIGTKGGKATLKHRNVRQLIVISESKAVATAVKGLNTITFGNINAIAFESLEPALNYVRANAA
jgi:hypothetical protein